MCDDPPLLRVQTDGDLAVDSPLVTPDLDVGTPPHRDIPPTCVVADTAQNFVLMK